MAGKDDTYVKNGTQSGLGQMHVPVWDGSPDTLEHYEEEVELLMLGTPVDNRKFLGPRLIQALPKFSMQRKAAARLSRKVDDESGIATDDGPSNIIKAFKSSMGDRPLPVAAERILKFFKQIARMKGESMAHWTEREQDTYEVALRAVQAIDPKVKELVPDVIRGMLAWESSGLTGPEKAMISAGLGGNWSRDSVVAKLQATWSDKDLRSRDGVRSDRVTVIPRKPFSGRRFGRQETTFQ